MLCMVLTYDIDSFLSFIVKKKKRKTLISVITQHNNNVYLLNYF